MAEEKKVYTVQGTVQGVYGPSSVDCVYGGKTRTKEKTDVQLQTPKGNKVKVTFWNQRFPDDLNECEVSITVLKYTGEYKGTAQFSANKDTKVHVLNQVKTSGEPEGVAEPQVSEPTTSGPGEYVEGGPVTKSAAVAPPEAVPPFEPDSVESPAEDTKPEPAKKRGRPAKKEAEPIVTSEKAKMLVTALVNDAWKIVDETADKLVQKDPIALQAYFATVFIALGKENYFGSKK